MNKVKLADTVAAPPSPASELVSSSKAARRTRLALVTAFGVGMAFGPPLAPHAQRISERGVKVTRIASSNNGRDGVVSISGDGNLNRAQTFQENGKFHIVLPYAKPDLAGGAPHGVKMQRVGDSLEIIVPVKSGARVIVQPRFNRLDLFVDGGLNSNSSPEENGGRNRARQNPTAPRDEAAPRVRRDAAAEPRATATAVARLSGRREAANENAAPAGPPEAVRGARSTVPSPIAEAWSSPSVYSPGAMMPTNATRPAATPQVAANAPAEAPVSPPVPLATTDAQAVEGAAISSSSISSSFFSWSGLLIVSSVLTLGGALFVRRRRTADEGDGEAWLYETEPKMVQKIVQRVKKAANIESSEGIDEQPFEQYKGDRRKNSLTVTQDRRRSGAGAEVQATHQLQTNGVLVAEGSSAEKMERRGGEPRVAHAPMPSVLFGAYRVDQEVTKLVQGEAHSIDVLASRAPDDRRAIETSLIKILQMVDADEDEKRRARAALEEYGFVARQSAALLLATDVYDRVSAARMLGQLKSATTLPFLLEALYDGEQVVRTEVVASLGALALPKAIGALLDMARRYPEIPAALIGNALTACSVESLELSWRDGGDSRTFALTGSREEFTGEIVGLEPTEVIEQLPEWIEDETLTIALELLESEEVELRVGAAQSLAQFQVRRGVEALSAAAHSDVSSAVRASAVTSLGQIDHESVFAAVLVAMADEAREVRAAAARALSGLNFERADAYVRVIETADAATLQRVAQACLKAGIAAQAVSRLASDDRRQAYEAFSLLSLVARAGETHFIIEAIEKHTDINVRLAAIRLLGQNCETEALEPLRELAGHGGLPEKVRAAILETTQHDGQLEAELA